MKISNLLIWPSVAFAYAITENNDMVLERDSDSADTPAEWANLVAAYATVAAGTGSVIIAGLAFRQSLATIMKNDSQKDTCGASYYSKVSSSGTLTHTETFISSKGPNCDTTAEVKTLLKAIQGCVDDLTTRNVSAGCCSFRHGGGTWRGHLKLATFADELRFVTCPPI